MLLDVRKILAASVMVSVAVTAWPAAAQAQEAGYKIVSASYSKRSYPYLSVDQVTAKLRPSVAAQLPLAEGRRLVLLNVNFLGVRNSGKMVRLDPADLQLQWDHAGARGAAPVLGVHVSKDFMPLGSSGFYTSMRPDVYEMFAIVPRDVRSLDLAQKQADGSFKLARAKIAIPPPR